MSKVFVFDTNHQPLALCSQRRAKKLLRASKAAVLRLFPFTIILNRAVSNPTLPALRLKIDPGSKKTGIAIVNDHTGEVVWAAELEHRGDKIKASLDSRRAIRRSRRNRKTRYRKPRFNNRTRKAGWLPPSIESRICNVITWVKRLTRLCPIIAISQELVKFDTQLLENPEISGLAYQQGTLAGYEVREFILEKYGRKCVYCGKRDTILEIEHIVPRSRGGSDRITNLTLACHSCNQKKGNRTAEEFGYPQVQAQAKAPLKDAAAVNASRWELYRRLQATGLPIETGTGGRTKFNRTQQGLPKQHWADAACVGASTPEKLIIAGVQPLEIKAIGHGSRQMCLVNKFGFPRTSAKAGKRFFSLQSGDIVKATITAGKKAGTYIGKVAVRARGYFNITTNKLIVNDINHKHCQRLHACDGYSYS
ncbi:MAG: RNA-guided endonuclease IscB [Acidobacteriota bacterium]